MSVQPPPAKSQPTVRHRLTVVEHISHQINGGNPTSVGATYSKTLNVEEEVYIRKTKSTGEKTPLDCGWLAGKPICMLHLKNEESGVTPDNLKTIELWMMETRICVIPPGEAARFCPAEISMLTLCSLSPAKYTLSLIPG